MDYFNPESFPEISLLAYSDHSRSNPASSRYTVTNELNFDSIELMETTQASFDHLIREDPNIGTPGQHNLTPRRLPVKRHSARILLLSLLLSVPAFSHVHTSGAIGHGDGRTRVYVVDSQTAGPVVMITAGIHGNEPAGPRAAEQIRHWTLKRGKLIIVPQANRPALKENTRNVPEVPEEIGNLNRNFPKNENEKPKCPLSTALWELAESRRPDWLLDLHEGIDFAQTSTSVGSSIIAGNSPEAKRQAQNMLDSVNCTITESQKEFLLKSQPVKGSLARAASELLPTSALILETTRKDQPLSLRIRQHRIMVHRFLTDLGMISSGVDTLIGTAAQDGQIRAAIYDAGGVGDKGPPSLEKDLETISNIVIRRIGAFEITGGALDQFDVLIVPGGSGSKQAGALGIEGRNAVADFIRNGGGYVGFCGGAYLAANNYTWSLKIVDADVIDRKHWKRGTGDVKIELTAKGRRILNDNCNPIDIYYANGPILQAGEDANIPDFKPLAFYRTEINTNNAPPGIMKDTPAIIAGEFGQGRVICSSPHPEYTDGLEHLVRNAVRWAVTK